MAAAALLSTAILTTKSAYIKRMFDGLTEQAKTANATIDGDSVILTRVIEFFNLDEHSKTSLLIDKLTPGHGQFESIKDIYEERHPNFCT